MKNTIKILCLILLTTFSLSVFAIGGIAIRPVQPPVNRNAIKPVSPVRAVNPDPFRRGGSTNILKQKGGTIDNPLNIMEHKGLPFPNSPSNEKPPLTSEEWKKMLPPQNPTGYYNHVQFNEFESQKREFIKSEALKCEGNACQVTLTGWTLLYDPNYPNPDYAIKFKAFISKNPSIKTNYPNRLK